MPNHINLDLYHSIEIRTVQNVINKLKNMKIVLAQTGLENWT